MMEGKRLNMLRQKASHISKREGIPYDVVLGRLIKQYKSVQRAGAPPRYKPKPKKAKRYIDENGMEFEVTADGNRRLRPADRVTVSGTERPNRPYTPLEWLDFNVERVCALAR